MLHPLRPGEGDLEGALSEQLVERIVGGLRRCGVRARGRVRALTQGTADGIARTALGYGADLIVVGSRRLPALAALLGRSVSHGVVHSTEVPVLICVPGAGVRAEEDSSHERSRLMKATVGGVTSPVVMVPPA